MAGKNVKTICITVTPTEEAYVDTLRKRYHRMNQREIYRLLINAGAEKLLGKKANDKAS